MKRVYSINKDVAPKNFEDFKRWYKAACNLPEVSAEEAFKMLGYKVPKNDNKRIKKEVE